MGTQSCVINSQKANSWQDGCTQFKEETEIQKGEGGLRGVISPIMIFTNIDFDKIDKY